MGCRVAKAWAAPERIEDCLQLRTTRDNDTNINDLQIEQQAEIIQISIKKGILVVPFNLKRDSSLEAVNTMGWRFPFSTINNDCRPELSLDPVGIFQRPFESCDDRRAAATGGEHFAAVKSESAKSLLYFFPLFGAGGLEDTNCVPPFVDFVKLGDVWRN